MDQAIKAEWVKALRSGKYKQGNGRLRDGDTFCCLGVLCDIGTKKAWASNGAYCGLAGDKRTGFLPHTISNLAGLSDYTQNVLSSLNDCAGSSFNEIADWIEKNL